MASQQITTFYSTELKRSRLAIFLLYFSQGLTFSSWASRIPDIKMQMGLDNAAWGTILLMIPIGQICGMAISGIMVSRIGSNRILPVCIIFYNLALILIGLASDQYTLIMSMIFFGFCGNFCNISINTQAVNIEAKYSKPIMASFHAGWSLAGLCGAAIGLLMAALGIATSYHFTSVALLCLANLFFNYKYLQTDIKKKKNSVEQAAKRKNKPESFLFLLGLVAFCGMAAEGAMADWSGLFLKDVVGIKESLAPIGLTAYMLTMATGRFFVDNATQKWGRRRVLQLGGLLISTGLFLAVAFPYFAVTLIAFMIIGLGTASIVPTIYSTAGQKTKISTGMALTIVSSVSFLGFLLGPPIIGYISHATNLRYSYALIGVFGIAIIALASLINVLKEDKPTKIELNG